MATQGQGKLLVSAPCAPDASCTHLVSRRAREASGWWWRLGMLRFAPTTVPTMLLASWCLGCGVGPAALMRLRCAAPPMGESSARGCSFALVPLMDAFAGDEQPSADSAALLERYQRSAAHIAPHELAQLALCACACERAAAEESDVGDAVPPPPRDILLALGGASPPRLVRLRDGAIVAEAAVVQKAGADVALPVALDALPAHEQPLAIMLMQPGWACEGALDAVLVHCTSLAQHSVATAVARIVLPLIPSKTDVLRLSRDPLGQPGALLLLPSAHVDGESEDDAMDVSDDAAHRPIHTLHGILGVARVLLADLAAAAFACGPESKDGMASVAEGLERRAALDAAELCAEESRLDTKATMAISAREMLAGCACAGDALLACGVRLRLSTLRGSFRHGDFAVRCTVLRDSAALGEAELHGCALTLSCAGTALAGRSTLVARLFARDDDCDARTLLAAVPAASLACCSPGGCAPLQVVLTGTVVARRHARGDPFAILLGQLQPDWSTAGATSAAACASFDEEWTALGVSRELCVSVPAGGTNLRTLPRLLCSALALAPRLGCDGATLVPQAGHPALPPHAALRLLPSLSAAAADVTLHAGSAEALDLLAAALAAAMPRDAALAGQPGGGEGGLRAARALADALADELRDQGGAARAQADTDAACAAMLLARAR